MKAPSRKLLRHLDALVCTDGFLTSNDGEAVRLDSQMRMTEKSRQAALLIHEVDRIKQDLDLQTHREMFILANLRISQSIFVLWALGYDAKDIAEITDGAMDESLIKEVLDKHVKRLRVPLIQYLLTLHDQNPQGEK